VCPEAIGNEEGHYKRLRAIDENGRRYEGPLDAMRDQPHRSCESGGILYA